MKNTLENKAKFFAQYWGQESHFDECYKGNENFKKPFLVDPENTYGCLELTPLSQISDEDAIEVAKMLFRDTEIKGINSAYYALIFSWRASNKGRWFRRSLYWNNLNIKQTDYLRSKGYALPWMGISVEALVEWGWVKLKTI